MVKATETTGSTGACVSFDASHGVPTGFSSASSVVSSESSDSSVGAFDGTVGTNVGSFVGAFVTPGAGSLSFARFVGNFVGKACSSELALSSA
jgi:hypothetical protein